MVPKIKKPSRPPKRGRSGKPRNKRYQKMARTIQIIKEKQIKDWDAIIAYFIALPLAVYIITIVFATLITLVIYVYKGCTLNIIKTVFFIQTIMLAFIPSSILISETNIALTKTRKVTETVQIINKKTTKNKRWKTKWQKHAT